MEQVQIKNNLLFIQDSTGKKSIIPVNTITNISQEGSRVSIYTNCQTTPYHTFQIDYDEFYYKLKWGNRFPTVPKHNPISEIDFILYILFLVWFMRMLI